MVIKRIPRILINFVISRMDQRFYIKIYLHELTIRQLVEFERQAGISKNSPLYSCVLGCQAFEQEQS